MNPVGLKRLFCLFGTEASCYDFEVFFLSLTKMFMNIFLSDDSKPCLSSFSNTDSNGRICFLGLNGFLAETLRFRPGPYSSSVNQAAAPSLQGALWNCSCKMAVQTVTEHCTRSCCGCLLHCHFFTSSSHGRTLTAAIAVCDV